MKPKINFKIDPAKVIYTSPIFIKEGSDKQMILKGGLLVYSETGLPPISWYMKLINWLKK